MKNVLEVSTTAADSPSVPAVSIWTVLAKCYRSVAAYLESSIVAEELGLSDFMVLEALLHRGPLPISALGRKVLLANASMTAAVDRLDERALVVRCNQKEDRRIRRIELTAKGRTLIETVYESHAKEIEALLAGLSSEERFVAHAVLKKIGFAAEAALENRTRVSMALPKPQRKKAERSREDSK